MLRSLTVLRSLLLAGEIATAVADPGPTPVPNPARPNFNFLQVGGSGPKLEPKNAS